MDVKKANELVLGFDSKLMYGFVGLFSEDYPEDITLAGLATGMLDYNWFKQCCHRAYFLPRGKIEDDSSFKQIIPYIVVRSSHNIFTYQRSGAEDRLMGNFSIGIGGHVNIQDVPTDGNFLCTVQNCAYREFFEELNFEKMTHTDELLLSLSFSKQPYFLYDPSDLVGSVHFGVVYIIDVSETLAAGMTMCDEGSSKDWLTVEELNRSEVWDNLEGWSRIIVESGCL